MKLEQKKKNNNINQFIIMHKDIMIQELKNNNLCSSIDIYHFIYSIFIKK